MQNNESSINVVYRRILSKPKIMKISKQCYYECVYGKKGTTSKYLTQ